jgi:hypothetical protein
MPHFNMPVPNTGPLAMDTSGTTKAGTLFPTLARAHNGGVASDGVYTSTAMQNPDHKGVRLTSVVANGSGTVTIKIQIQDPAAAGWIDLAGAATAALNNTAGAIITVYPGLTGIADSTGVTINQHLGNMWRVVATVATASETFSVGAVYLA